MYQLQVNDSGAWKRVVSFDASRLTEVSHHARLLFKAAARGVSLRIIAEGGPSPKVILQLLDRGVAL